MSGFVTFALSSTIVLELGRIVFWLILTQCYNSGYVSLKENLWRVWISH